MSGSDKVCVGALAGALGVKGEVRLKSFCAEPEAIFGYALETEDGTRRFDATYVRSVKNGFAARLSGVATKEDADTLRGTRLYALRAELPDLEDDACYC